MCFINVGFVSITHNYFFFLFLEEGEDLEQAFTGTKNLLSAKSWLVP